MAEALMVVYAAATLQTSIVHLIRNSLDYTSWKERKQLAAAIRPIYTAASAEAELNKFEEGPPGQKFYRGAKLASGLVVRDSVPLRFRRRCGA